MRVDDAALVVVDVQNDFCPGGALEVPDGDAVVPAVNRIAPRFAARVLTQDWHPPGHRSFASSHPGRAPFETAELPYGAQVLWPDHCVQGTAGAAFHPALATDGADLVLRKGFRPGIDSYSAFYENDRRTATGLAGYLRGRGISRLLFVGSPPTSASPGRRSTAPGRASKRRSSKTPAAPSTSTAPSPPPGSRWPPRTSPASAPPTSDPPLHAPPCLGNPSRGAPSGGAYIPHTVIARRSSGRSSRRKSLSSHRFPSLRSKMTRCPASAPQRSM